MSSTRQPYTTDVSDKEWTFVAPYLTLLSEDAGQRRHDLREVYNGVRYIVKTGAHWRNMPHDLPPWPVVYQQMRRWLAAGCFEHIVHDLRVLHLRVLRRRAADRPAPPTAVILDSRTLQATPTSGARAGYEGHKRRKGSKVHVAVDTLGEVLALVVTPANAQDRAQVAQLATAVQAVTGQTVELAWVDHAYTGDAAAEAAQAHGIQLVVVKLPEARRGFVLLPRRWVLERSFGWVARFRRLARDYERLATSLAGLHFLAFACLMLHQFTHLISSP
jgi:transposase